MRCLLIVMCALVAAGTWLAPSANSQVTGSLTQWQPIEVEFQGPTGLSETSGTNPFLDYRLQVQFTSGTTTYDVPGFFDGVDPSGTSIWKARFTPDQAGSWNYNTSFRTGSNVSVDLDANSGSAVSFNGSNGNFSAVTRDANAPGFLSKGRLSYVGGHYLQSLGDQRYWLKSGADSPENLLGYSGFDNTPEFDHQFAPHRSDWNAGDPDWTNESANVKGGVTGVRDAKNLIGAINYLSDVGVNSVYFLPMNIGGDGKDTSPYTTVANWNGNSTGSLNDNTRFDVSKLAQWETAFAHAQAKGINLHVVLNEAELNNKHELDDATLGVERKLFYREMVARFGHHNALQWNMSEEYNGFGAGSLTADTVKEWAAYLSAVDPYDHPLTVHNAGNPSNTTSGPWAPFIGDSDFDVTSLQYAGQARTLGATIEGYRAASTNAGRPIPVMIDEPESITRIAVGQNDNTDPSGDTLVERYNTVRKEMTWDIYFSGGSIEWFVHDGDQSAEDLVRFEQVFKETAIAREFMEDNLQFWLMTPDDDLLRGEDVDYGGGEVFALLGEEYAFYLPDGSNDDNSLTTDLSPELDLRGFDGQTFSLRWFNPRTGQFEGSTIDLVGGDWVALGYTPDGFQNVNDWVGLVTINAVPEPACVWVVSFGILLVSGLNRRRR